jgi:hypothetical protein
MRGSAPAQKPEPVEGVNYVCHEVAGFRHRVKFSEDVVEWVRKAPVGDVLVWLSGAMGEDRLVEMLEMVQRAAITATERPAEGAARRGSRPPRRPAERD